MKNKRGMEGDLAEEVWERVEENQQKSVDQSSEALGFASCDPSCPPSCAAPFSTAAPAAPRSVSGLSSVLCSCHQVCGNC